jgi:hypothetical protein
VVASTTGAVFIRAVDDRLFECAVVGGDDTLNSMFNQHGIKFSGLQTKLISACSELEPQTREASLFLLALWVLRAGGGRITSSPDADPLSDDPGSREGMHP